MLAVKTVLADSDEIPTLIFDEIDTGISGRTAQKVSEKLSYISKTHQVICITHLPQIGAMADTHFEIAKHVVDKKTVTNHPSIRRNRDGERAGPPAWRSPDHGYGLSKCEGNENPGRNHKIITSKK